MYSKRLHAHKLQIIWIRCTRPRIWGVCPGTLRSFNVMFTEDTTLSAKNVFEWYDILGLFFVTCHFTERKPNSSFYSKKRSVLTKQLSSANQYRSRSKHDGHSLIRVKYKRRQYYYGTRLTNMDKEYPFSAVNELEGKNSNLISPSKKFKDLALNR